MNATGAGSGAMLREHRRSQGISQARVAARIEAQQSQISRFEKGEVGILAPQKIVAYAKLVGVDATQLAAAAEPARPACYCSDPACPGNLPFYQEGTLHVRPRFQVTDRAYCRFCGEALEASCPQCEADLQEGYYCGGCGHPYVAAPESLARGTATEARVREVREGREALLQLAVEPTGPLRLVGGHGA